MLCSILLSCGNAPKAKSIDAPEKIEATPTPTALPSIPVEELQTLFLEVDYVDYIFYDLPISMSYDNKKTIQSALRWVSQNTDIPASGCKALGRMILQKDGNQIMEAELYVSDSCGHYIWYKDGKKVYNNKMTNEGHQHYMGIINQFVDK